MPERSNSIVPEPPEAQGDSAGSVSDTIRQEVAVDGTTYSSAGVLQTDFDSSGQSQVVATSDKPDWRPARREVPPEEDFSEPIKRLLADPEKYLRELRKSPGGLKEGLKAVMKDQVLIARSAGEGRLNEYTMHCLQNIYTRYPSSTFLENVLNNVKGGDGAYETVSHYLGVFGQHTAMMSPFDGLVKLDREGRMPTQELDLAILFTDIRSFSKLSHELADNTFAALQQLYYAFVARIVQKHGMRVFNTGGDALAIYCTDIKDMHGNVTESKENRIVDFAFELNKWTNFIAAMMYKFGFGKKEKAGETGKEFVPLFETGIGITSGKVKVGDCIDQDASTLGMIGETRKAISVVIEKDYPLAKFDKSQKLVMTLSEVVSRASRLETLDSLLDADNVIVDKTFWINLSDHNRSRLKPKKAYERKGVGELDVLAGERERISEENFKAFVAEFQPEFDRLGITIPDKLGRELWTVHPSLAHAAEPQHSGATA